MKSTKRLFLALFAFSATTAIFSCGNPDTAESTDAAKSADTSTAATPAKPEFTPFEVMTITHTVADYSKWKPFFDADAANRKANGLEDMVVGRNADNPNSVQVVTKVTNPEVAKAFSSDPKLKEVMEKAGVSSKPVFEMYHVIRFNTEAKEKNWVTITHRVKDFDAWVKVFDQEGAAQRLAEGMIDVALARATDDPNNVLIVFDITDMAKAKAAIFSEGKKQLMTSAGVEGKPRIEFYTLAE